MTRKTIKTPAEIAVEAQIKSPRFETTKTEEQLREAAVALELEAVKEKYADVLSGPVEPSDATSPSIDEKPTPSPIGPTIGIA